MAPKKTMKDRKKETVRVQFVTCINADDPSLATPVTIINKVERSVWEESNQQYDMPLVSSLYKQSLAAIYNQGMPWTCRVCSSSSCMGFATDEYTSTETHHVKPYAATLKNSIVIPICGVDPNCSSQARRLCDNFSKKNLDIDAFNKGTQETPLGISDVGTLHKPSMIYTFHVDADEKEGGQVYRVPFFEPFPGPWMSLEGKQQQFFTKMVEGVSIASILKENEEKGHPLLCRECSKPAQDFAYSGSFVVPVEDEAVYVSRDIAIPICSGELDSPCWVRAQQQVERFMRNKEGDKSFDRRSPTCSHCSKKESKGMIHKQCSRCKVMSYCSKECQVANWKMGHKKACQPWPWNPTATSSGQD